MAIGPIDAELLIFSLEEEVLLLRGELDAPRPGMFGGNVASVDERSVVDPQLGRVGEGSVYLVGSVKPLLSGPLLFFG